MSEKTRDRPEQEWQKADARVLGQLLAAQNIIFTLPDTTRVAEFYAQALLSVPGLTGCRVCLRETSALAGEMPSGVCKECDRLRNTGEESETRTPPSWEFKCNLADRPNIRFTPIASFHRHFGFFVFEVKEAAVFDLYHPFVINLANYVAISLENRLQRDLLQKARGELERKVEERTRELRASNETLAASRREALNLMQEAVEARQQTELVNADLQREVTERQRAEEALGRELDVNKAMSDLSQALIAQPSSIKDVADSTLHYARSLTGSAHGFASFIDPRTGDNVAHTLTEMMGKQCQLTGEHRRIAFPVDPDGRYPRLWGHALNTRQPFYTNAPASHESAGGTPIGHIPLRNFLAAPALFKDRLVGEVALANAARDYTDEDLSVVARLANLYAIAVARAEAQQTLRDSEQRWRSLLQTVEVGVIIHDPESRVIASNTVAQEVLGLSEEQMLGRPSDDPAWCFIQESGAAMPPELYPVNRVISTGQPFHNLVVGIIRPNRPEPTWTLVNADPVHDPDGALREVIVVFMDITERRLAEEARRNAERHLRTIVESFPDFIARFDEQGRHLYINPAVEKGLGVKLEDYVGKTLHDLDTPGPSGQNEMLLASIQQAFEGASQNFVEAVWPTPKGDRTFEVRHIPEISDDGTVVSVIGVTRDVTERRLAEEEIAWNLAVNQALSSLYIPLVATGTSIEQIAGVVLERTKQLTSSAHGYVAEVDPATGDLVAHTNTAMMQTECTVAEEELRKIRFPQGADGLYRGLWGHTLNSREPFYTDGPMNHPASVGIPEGHIAIERFLTVPVLLAGQLVGQIALANSTRVYTDRDLDAVSRIAEFYALAIQHRRAEEEIRKLNEELEQRVLDRTAELEAAYKELEAFSYSVSHDLRAPLRHLAGFVNLVTNRASEGLDEKNMHYLSVIADSATQMGELIDGVLSFSRMGRIGMSMTRLSMRNLVDEALQVLRDDVAGRDIKWKVGALPEVRGSREMLRTVLVNLLSNAIKFTVRETQAIIEVGHTSANSEEDVFFVRDNGVGLDMKYADKSFGLFQRLHQADEFEGTGLGLANVRRIIGRHGGRTWAEGVVGEGATFYFSLPRDGGG